MALLTAAASLPTQVLRRITYLSEAYLKGSQEPIQECIDGLGAGDDKYFSMVRAVATQPEDFPLLRSLSLKNTCE